MVLLTSCTSFEDPALVIDLRVIAMTASPPEQVLDLDLANPLGGLMAQLQPSIICAHVADPARAGNLHWQMRACLLDNGRCDPNQPKLDLGFGEAIDPELAPGPFCAPVVPSLALIAILVEAFGADPIHGLAGLSYAVELQVGASDGSRDDDQFAIKELHVFARLPKTRVANHNPTLSSIQLLSPDLDLPVFTECASDRPHPIVPPRTRVALVPVELTETRESYPVLTISGAFEAFPETIRYQYLATAGEVTEEFSGGPPDFVGNEPGLGTTWIAPDVGRGLDAQLWAIQRDERGGASVYPLCIHVAP